MNRIQTVVAQHSHAAIPAPQSDFRVEVGRYSTGDGELYSIFVPLHYEPNYAYPLLVWLHGPGDDEHQLRRLMPHISMRNHAAIGVRGTVEQGAVRGRPTYGWSPLDGHFHLAAESVLESLRAGLERMSIARERVFIGGFDCGGAMALRVAMEHPELFAGAISIGGAFPQGSQALRRLHEARRLPILLCCGRESAAYPQEQLADDLRLLHSAGMKVDVRLYPCGQEIMTNMLSDVDRWLMSRVEAIKAAARGAEVLA